MSQFMERCPCVTVHGDGPLCNSSWRGALMSQFMERCPCVTVHGEVP